MSARDTAEGFLLSPAPVTSHAQYEAAGGCRGLRRAQELGPAAVIAEIDRAGLRGRGGAGFPTGRKWASIRSAPGTHYFAVNGAEGEPGTFKDRALMRSNPYQLLEGAAIACLAVGATEGFVAVKHTFERELAGLRRAAQEMTAAGMLGEVPLTIVEGPDEYLFGEEKALLEVIEGKAPLPRLFPPYQQGLFATGIQMGWEAQPTEPGASSGRQAERNPDPHATLVNNVETLSNVPHILANGADWFRGFGTEQSPGILVVTVVGDVVQSGLAEVELGVSLRDAIDAVGGGPRPGRSVKAVFSGISNPVLTAQELDTPLTYEDMAAIGNGLGAAGFIVYDDTTSMVEVARLFSRFLAVESCGQCPACKVGNGEIADHLDAIAHGNGNESDIEIIGRNLRIVTDGNRCALPQETQNVIGSLLTRFPEEFVVGIEGGSGLPARGLQMPKLIDIVDGQSIYDERYQYKQMDWTYSDGRPPEA
jgi:NADH:ubiquinone oxidoreductase subunit F (NADH-binding)